MTRLTAIYLFIATIVFLTKVDAFPSYRNGQTNPSPFLQRRSIPDNITPSKRLAQLGQIGQILTGGGSSSTSTVAYTPDAAHPYQAPGTTDERGPCPGLNTLANHGYIPRSGIVHWQDIVQDVKDGFNMANDFGTILGIYAVLSEGDVTTGMFSIGGNLQSNLVGGQKGLQTHGAFEGDASLARLDQYPTGRNWQFDNGTYCEFKAVNAKYSAGNATINSLTQYRYQRFMESKANNPQFTFLFPRYLFSYGEAALTLQMFSNRASNGGSDYNVSPTVLDSFFVNQTFPPNFIGKQQPYTFLDVVTDALLILTPNLVLPGANAGVNNYVPLGISLNASNLTPSAYGCALYNSLISFLPSSLLGVPTTLASSVNQLANTLHTPFLNAFQCQAGDLSRSDLGLPIGWLKTAVLGSLNL